MQQLNGRSPVIIYCYCSLCVFWESIFKPLLECFFSEYALRMVFLMYVMRLHKTKKEMIEGND